MLRKYRFISFVVVLIFVVMGLIFFRYKNSTLAVKRNEIDTNKRTKAVETITYVQGKDSSLASKTLINMFQKENPDIKVNFEELPNSTDDQHNILAAKFSAADTNYDVIAMDLVWTAEFADAGWLEPLDESFTENERDKYFDWAIKSVTYKNHIYGIPRSADVGLLYYRKDLLPKAPESWDELIGMCDKYTGKNNIKYGIVFQGNQYEGLICDAVEFIGSNGGSIMKDGKITINTPQAIQGLKFMRKLIKDKYAPPEVVSYQEEDALYNFEQGKTLFMRNWPYAWFQLNDASKSKVKGKVGITKIPRGKNVKNGSDCLGGWNLGINKNSLHKAAALKFIKFMTSDEGQRISAIKASLLPTRKALYKDKDILKSNSYWYNFYDILKGAISRPASPVYSSISDELQVNIHKAITGEITEVAAVKEMEKGLRKIVDKR